MNYPLSQGIHGFNKRANEQTPTSQQQGKQISILRANQLSFDTKKLQGSTFTKDVKGTCMCEVTIKVKEKRPHIKVVRPFDPTEMIYVAWSLRQTTSKLFKGKVDRR
jgi:hypothetical protein